MTKIHMMGVTGSGMSGVATLATKMGYEVTGCDIKVDGHDAAHLNGIDLLVVSPAVLYQSKTEPELVQAQKSKIVVTWEEFVGKFLMKDKFVIAIAGTHGKSTTTAMVGKILEDNGFDPTVIIGANVPEWGGNSRFGKSKYFVIEADEFNDNFLNYHPDIAVINNIEFDHPDYFKDEKQLIQSFEKFKNLLVGNKILITEKDSKNIKFNLKVFGEHNQKNANMAYLIGKELGIKDEEILKSLESFTGIGRRMEKIAENIYDDYAHHPTAIKTTLEGLRKEFPNKKIWAVIEPHGYKRTEALLDLYKGAFDSIDRVFVGPIFKARDVVNEEITPKLVSDKSGFNYAVGVNSFEEILEIIKKEITPDVILIFMGAGNSSLWAKKTVKESGKYSFKDLTTLKVGGEILHYKEASNKDELKSYIKFAKENKLPVFILGGGSDIAVSDNSFDGLVIKYVGNKITNLGNIVLSEAGAMWDDLVKFTVEKNLSGMECLSGIPGTVGAAPIQNIGAYGQEISETFVSLNAYDIENEKFVEFKKEDCKFDYRNSIFKTKDYWQKFVIIDVTFKLNKYEDKDLSLQDIRNEILRVRSEKLENPNEVPNAGSFFMNPIIDKSKKEELEKIYPDIKTFEFNDKFKVPAGWLIEKTEWKGKSLGPVKVSDKHALILTNPNGNGSFSDIKKLADAIIGDVNLKFGIKLEPEVQYINL